MQSRLHSKKALTETPVHMFIHAIIKFAYVNVHINHQNLISMTWGLGYEGCDHFYLLFFHRMV